MRIAGVAVPDVSAVRVCRDLRPEQCTICVPVGGLISPARRAEISDELKREVVGHRTRTDIRAIAVTIHDGDFVFTFIASELALGLWTDERLIQVIECVL